jgi:hypothetical protein
MPEHSAPSSVAIHFFHDSKLSIYSTQNLTNKRGSEQFAAIIVNHAQSIVNMTLS